LGLTPMKPRHLLILAATLVLSLPADARDTARQFLGRCEMLESSPSTVGPSDRQFFAGYCIGVIQGVSDGATYAVNFMRGSGRLRESRDLFCIPPEVPKGKIAKVLIDYGKRHPELLDGPDIALIPLALAETYPCK